MRGAQASGIDAVAVVLLNWRNAVDTLACVESLLLTEGCEFRIIVCDNDSGDGSQQAFLDWAAASGGLASTTFLNPLSNADTRAEVDDSARVIWLQTGANLGFAGGCNVGIAHAMRRPACRYIWLLNNDCTVDPAAMRNLVRKMDHDPSLGVCGSTLRYAAPPHRLQAAAGAIYNRWTGRAHYIDHMSVEPSIDEAAVETRLTYVCGASMFVRRQFIEQVGPMCTDYFLYFEEIDWVTRPQKGYRMGFCRASVVFHKEGATMGSDSDSRRSSALADYYLFRNRLRFTARHFAHCLPTVWTIMLLQALVRGWRGQPDRMIMILKIMFGAGEPPVSNRTRG